MRISGLHRSILGTIPPKKPIDHSSRSLYFSLRRSWKNLKEATQLLVPLNFSEHRIHKSFHCPDSYLGKIDKILSTFKYQKSLSKFCEPTDSQEVHISSPITLAADQSPILPLPEIDPAFVTPATIPTNSSDIFNEKMKTELLLDQFLINGCCFFLFDTLLRLGSIKDPDPHKSIITMMKNTPLKTLSEASLFIKTAFYEKYKDQLGRKERLKIWFFLSWTSFFISSCPINAYENHFLKQLRTSLKENTKTDIAERLIAQVSRFLDLYKTATLDYAQTKEPTGIVQQYRDKALDQIFEKSLKIWSEEFTTLWIKNLSPNFEFFKNQSKICQLCNRIVNEVYRHALNQYAKNVIHLMMRHSNRSSENFTKYLIDYLTEQMQQITVHFDDRIPFAKDSYVPDNYNIRGIIKNLFYVIKFSNSHTQDSILNKQNELDKKNAFDEEIEKHMEDLLFKVVQSVSQSLLTPLTIEKILSQVFTCMNLCFFQEKTHTDADLQVSKDQLDLMIRGLGKCLAKFVMEKKIQQDPAKEKHSAEFLMTIHQSRSMDVCVQLDVLALKMLQRIENAIHYIQNPQNHSLEEPYPAQKKINNSCEQPGTDLSESLIINDLSQSFDAIAQSLERYTKEEKTCGDVMHLPKTDQERISRVLIPIYQGFEKASQKLLSIQKLQLLYEHVYSKKAQSTERKSPFALVLQRLQKRKRQKELLNILRKIMKEEQSFIQHLNALKKQIQLQEKNQTSTASYPDYRIASFFNIGKKVVHQFVENRASAEDDMTVHQITQLLECGCEFFLTGKVHKPIIQITLQELIYSLKKLKERS